LEQNWQGLIGSGFSSWVSMIISFPVSWLACWVICSKQSAQVLLPDLSISRINSGLHSCWHWEQVNNLISPLLSPVFFTSFFNSSIVLFSSLIFVCNLLIISLFLPLFSK